MTSIKLLTLFLAVLCLSSVQGNNDSSVFSLYISAGNNKVAPPFMAYRHPMPWYGNSNYNFTYLENSSNNAVYSLLPGRMNFHLSAGVEYKLHKNIWISTGLSYQRSNLDILRLDYDSTSLGERYRISDTESSFYPPKYQLRYNFISIPVLMDYRFGLANRAYFFNFGIGFNMKTILGQPIDAPKYMNSMDSSNILTGVNIIQNHFLAFSPMVRIRLERAVNKKYKLFISSLFETVTTRRLQSIDIIDVKSDKTYISSAFPKFSNWSISIGVIKKIK